MPTILISGAASGLGRAFVEAFQQQHNTTLLCLDRQQCNFVAPNIECFVVDITREDSVQQFAAQVESRSINLVLHSAGIRGLVPVVEAAREDNVEACETMQVMDSATLLHTFHTNAVGTFLLLRALLPSLKLAQDPKVVVMSSRMGSIGNNQAGKRAAGGSYAYRASKAALNMMIRSFAIDEPDVTFVLCHPGRVETKLVKWKEDGAIKAEESVRDMLPLIRTWSRKNTGRYYDRFGEEIEW